MSQATYDMYETDTADSWPIAEQGIRGTARRGNFRAEMARRGGMKVVPT